MADADVPRILVVDAEPAIGAAIGRLLRAEYAMLALSSAADALARVAARECFDLVIADVALPSMTCAEFYAALRRCAPQLARTMLFMSTGTGLPGVDDFLRTLANPCLEKPFGAHELSKIVRQQLTIAGRLAA